MDRMTMNSNQKTKQSPLDETEIKERKRNAIMDLSPSSFILLFFSVLFRFLSYDDIFITFYCTKNQSTEVLNKIDNSVKNL